MRNYENHKLILEAIEDVRAELKEHDEREGFNLKGAEILMRLANLYSLVDVADIKRALVELEKIDQRRAEVLPRYKKAA